MTQKNKTEFSKKIPKKTEKTKGRGEHFNFLQMKDVEYSYLEGINSFQSPESKLVLRL